MKTIVTIAGSDSSGGAGIQADLKTITMLKQYGASIITAITAQNTCGVYGTHNIPVEMVEAQFDAVFTDLSVAAAKTGMLSNGEIAEAVARKLKQYRCPHLVVDPVMISTSGTVLLQEDAMEVIWNELFPLAELVTPNLHETRKLTGMTVETPEDMRQAGIWIQKESGCRNVLVKGGHLNGNAIDVLCGADGETYYFEERRIDTRNTHGTGCTLSAAIASCLGMGHTMESAVYSAKQYLTKAIDAARNDQIGKGHGPVRHNYLLHHLDDNAGVEMHAVKRDGGIWINPLDSEK